jgi:phosphatidylglycerol:prolipoprotein diacylglycerol transferase
MLETVRKFVLPELFRIPFLNLPVHTYGALYVLALLVGMFIAYRQALRSGGKYHNDVMDFGFWVLVGILIGARVLFIIVEYRYYFVDEPFTKIPLGISIPTVLALWKGGFVFWGGVIGGTIAMIVFCKKRKIPIAEFADFCAPALALGHAIGRVGCVAGGCCYGSASFHVDSHGKVIADSALALAYPPGSIAYSALLNQASDKTAALMHSLGSTVPLFPVQLLESLGNTAIFFILMMLVPFKRAHGQIALIYFILYSAMRSFTETFRGDSARGFVIDNILSTSQFISIVMSLLALVLIIVLSRRSHQAVQLES